MHNIEKRGGLYNNITYSFVEGSWSFKISYIHKIYVDRFNNISEEETNRIGERGEMSSLKFHWWSKKLVSVKKKERKWGIYTSGTSSIKNLSTSQALSKEG